ncbi:hypothetical protein N836_06440 [Leptolyngbya sp. Heron Island J]|uniref:hypothetical protein n=1 Tax=Leptolyngbya sp. Heron Island J TaxID=1385935 RepID=UPI0003B95EE7|nr:hypothetical protein [Leptolyngbya sp. Heron Island J]ESA36694.1 hypothetical protein N836_06440 [Leptolyngbya sp. Heron Island J]
MNLYSSDAPNQVTADIEEIRLAVQVAARKRANDCAALLTLLRELEDLHRDICETLFQESLPNNRQHLYHLLRDIELNGGWPYIQRVKLKELLNTLEMETAPDTSDE